MDKAPELQPSALFRIGFFLELGLVIPAAAAGAWFLGGPFPFRIALDARGLLAAVEATVPAAAVALLLTSGIGRRIGALRRIYGKVKAILGTPLQGLTLAEMVLLAGAAGIGEEVLFRGVLQQMAGLYLTSLLFGMLHALTPAYFVLATGMGLYLGWVAETSKNLLVPILVHALYDALALYLLQRQFLKDKREAAPSEEADSGGEEPPPEDPGA